MAEQGGSTRTPDLNAMLATLGDIAAAQRAKLAAETDPAAALPGQDQLRQIERASALLDATAEFGDAANDLRLLMAAGLAQLQLPANTPDTTTPPQLIPRIMVEALWPLVVAPRLPLGWFGTLKVLASNEIAIAVSDLRGTLHGRDAQRLKLEFTQRLADARYASGILALAEDLLDERGGGAALVEQFVTARPGATAAKPDKGARFGLLHMVLVSAGVAGVAVAKEAVGGIVGNRADALFMQVAEHLKSFQPAPAQAAPSTSPPPSPLPAGITLAGMEFCLVPAGEFLMGSDKALDPQAFDDELPQHRVYLDAYYIGRYPVTVAQFAAFVRAAKHQTTAEREGFGWVWNGNAWGKTQGANWQNPRGPQTVVSGKQDHPVTQVSWHDAMAFCCWLSETTGREVTLPSEAEWEKAARGSDGRIWPWGNTFDKNKANTFESGIGDTTPVGSYGAKGGDSPYGCADMVGNVWEWTRSLWGKDRNKPEFGYPYSHGLGEREDESADDGVLRVPRGGSFRGNGSVARVAYRNYGYQLGYSDHVGFRCVVRLHLS